MIKECKTEELKEGMKTAEDVYTPQKQLIIEKGTVLTELNISHIDFYSIKSILIYAEEEKPAEPIKEAAPAPAKKEIVKKSSSEVVKNLMKSATAPKQENVTSEIMTSAKKITATPAFQSFQVNFTKHTEQVKDNFQKLVNLDGEINTREYLEDIYSVFPKKEGYISPFDMLSNMKGHDDATFIHSQSVAILARSMGTWLHLPLADIDVLTLCGLFHDIGKMFVPEEILNKKDRLTINEKAIVQAHSKLGYDFIKDKDVDERIKQVVLNHHERLDGSGYPNKLKGDQIDQFSRIIAIADVYAAMTSARKHRKAFCPFTVIEELEKNGLHKYDTKLLLMFLEKISNGFLNNWVLLSNGQTGYIVMINKGSLARPIVRVGKEFIDLSKEKDISITSLV